MRRLLRQTIILNNLVLTGLRGVGKTVLLDTFRPLALQTGWLWAGTDLSESASVTEERLAIRILADLALVTSALVVREIEQPGLGFGRTDRVIREPLNYDILKRQFDDTPGLISDKLKATLEFVWSVMPHTTVSGIVFAYDEAQNLADHSGDNEYPLSVLLDVFQSIQRKQIPFLLVLVGLPTLFPKLVEARTYSERMFHILFLTQLNEHDSRDAIVKPIEDAHCPIKFSEETATRIVEMSGGYPFFIQFICKEVYDVWITRLNVGEIPGVPVSDIFRKLDQDFFYGRWANATDRQRELLRVIALLPNANLEFTVQEIVNESQRTLHKPFSGSHVSQIVSALIRDGLLYKTRYGKYSLAVPMLSGFILRQITDSMSRPPPP